MLYADKLMEYVNQINSPIKTTSTTTAKANEGIDLSGLLTMLMMSQMFKKPTAVSPNQSALNLLSQQNLPPAAGYAGMGGAGGTDNLMQMLASLGSLIGK